MSRDVLHVIGAGCVARDLHTIEPRALEPTYWSRRSEEIVENLKLRLSMPSLSISLTASLK